MLQMAFPLLHPTGFLGAPEGHLHPGQGQGMGELIKELINDPAGGDGAQGRASLPP